MSDKFLPPRRYRLLVKPGRWHAVEGALSVMVIAQRTSVASCLLLFDGLTTIQGPKGATQVDWETLVEWGLAEPTKPPASVTPLRPSVPETSS